MPADRRAERIEAALDALDAGGVDALDRFLAGHPEDAQWLRARLVELQGFGVLHPRSTVDPVPVQLGEFVLKERLGGGGMGIVHRAHQPSLQRDVALKVIRPEHLFFAGARERFRREVESIARLEHPNIVRVYEAGNASGLPYFTMELVDGVSLEALLDVLRARRAAPADDRALAAALERMRAARGSTAPLLEPSGRSWIETCLGWAKELAGALAYAHGVGVLHRDVKPANVMLMWSGRTMLLDFGLATTRGATRITGTGSMVGSVPYMAPEQLRGAREQVDPRTDVYALGVTLYELLALRHPFHARGQETEETRRRILDGAALPLRRVAAGVPWDVETVCLTAMERDPARRYPSAAALAADLDHVLHFRPILARRPGVALRLRRFTQRHPAWSVGAALGFVLVTGGPLGLWWTQLERTRAVAAEQARTAQARDAAERRFELALDAIDKVLSHIGAVELRDVPDAGKVRRELLELAARSARQLHADLPDHPRAQFVAATVDQQLAHVMIETGRLDEARRLAARAIEVLGRDDGAAAADPRRVLVHAHAEAALGHVALLEERRSEAAARYAAAIDLHRAALDATEEVGLQDDHKRALSRWLINWGTELALNLGRVDEGKAGLAEATELLEEIGMSWQDLLLLGHAFLNLGVVREGSAEAEPAESAYARAVELCREVLQSVPRNLEARRSLAHGLCSLAIAQGKRRQHDLSIPALEECIALARELCAGFPERLDVRRQLAFALATLGAQQFDRNELETAAACFEEALAAYDELAVAPGVAPAALLERALARSHFAVVRHASGDPPGAAALHEQARADFQAAARLFPAMSKRVEEVRRHLEANREDAAPVR